MEIISHSEKETLVIGKSIAASLKKGDILCLYGQLGAGKTVLAKGIAQGLGIRADQVISPSFVLLREHLNSHIPLFHFDLYRLKDVKSILDLGYEEYFFNAGITLVEWPERLGKLLPENFLKVQLSIGPKYKRTLKFNAFGQRPKELLKEINENIRH